MEKIETFPAAAATHTPLREARSSENSAQISNQTIEDSITQNSKLRSECPKNAVIVLGGGPTGLSTALGVALNCVDREAWVLEKKETPGGLSGSFQWKDHIIDYGPHRLSPNLKSVRVIAQELLGPDCLVNKSQHGVQFGGRLYQFPPRVIDWINLRSLIEFSLFTLSFFAAKFGWLIRRFKTDDFESTVVAKFGRRFFTQVVAPMAQKVWVNPQLIDPAFVNQRFAIIQPLAVIKRLVLPRQELNPSHFYYPRKGFQQLWDNLAAYLQRAGQKVLYESIPSEITVENNRIVRIQYCENGKAKTMLGQELDVISTIPVLKLLEILKGIETNSLLEKAKRLKFKSMFLVAFEFNQTKTLPFRTHIYPEKQFCFNRLFEQNSYSRETVTDGKSVIVADITYMREGEESKMTDGEVIEMVRKDLEKLSYVDLSKLSGAHVERVDFAYVVPDLESRRYFHEIHHELKKIQNLYLAGRFSIGEYDNSDYAIDNGLALGTTLSGRASKLEYLFVQHEHRGRNIVG